MKDKLSSLGLLWLRVLGGLGIAYHGYGKIFEGHVAGLSQAAAKMGFPAPLAFAWAAALSEFAGGLLLVLGLGTRFAAFFVFATMSTAVFIHHRLDPLQVKELALAYWTIAGALIAAGGGCFSLDALLFGKRKG